MLLEDAYEMVTVRGVKKVDGDTEPTINSFNIKPVAGSTDAVSIPLKASGIYTFVGDSP